MKTLVYIFGFSALLLLFSVPGWGKSDSVKTHYTIEECYELAQQNHPLVKRYDLLSLTEEYSLKNASLGYLPQVSLLGAASYQSEALEFPFDIQGTQMPVYSKDQYTAVLQLSQVIWDGGKIAAERKNIQAKTAVDMAQHQTDIYSIREKINDLYFGILYIDEQLHQTQIVISELDKESEKISKCIENGVANLCDMDLIEVEKITYNQNVKKLSSMLETYLKMLSILTGVKIDDSSMLTRPFDTQADPRKLLDDILAAKISRPELALFLAQKQQVDARSGLRTADALPQVSLFVHGGYGRQGYNIFDNTFRPFAVGGIKLSWNISQLYGIGHGRKILNYSKAQIDMAQDAFIFSTNLQIEEQSAETRRLIQVIEDDKKIVALRENIRKSMEAAVENGTKNTSDLISQLNQESIARQQLLIHEIELLKSLYELKNIKNH